MELFKVEQCLLELDDVTELAQRLLLHTSTAVKVIAVEVVEVALTTAISHDPLKQDDRHLSVLHIRHLDAMNHDTLDIQPLALDHR